MPQNQKKLVAVWVRICIHCRNGIKHDKHTLTLKQALVRCL